VNCAEAAAALGPFSDGELAPDAAATLRAHVAGCAHCRGELAALAALGRDVRAQAPRHAAPAALRERVRAELERHRAAPAAAAPAPTARARERRRWFAAGVLAGALLAVALGTLTTVYVQRKASDDVTVEAVESHVRATLGHHLIEVASSDRHTVKPWLSARLDYAAPVPDAIDAAFTLAGARLDSLDRRPVAALVYRYGNHVVDVFVRPLGDGADAMPLARVRGFTVARAVGAGMEWRAVADVDAAVLAGFVERLAREAEKPTPR
jgi:anti-sigma factor (TIGR02949 family)